MMEVDHNEKYYSIFKIVLLVLTFIVIAIFGIFFFAVSKVNAATQYRVAQDNSWGSWNNIILDQNVSSNNVYFSGTGGSKLQFRDTTAMTNGRKYDFKLYFDVVVGIRSSQGDYSFVINGDVTTELYNGSNLVDMDDKCTVRHTTSVSSSTKRFSFAVDCTGFSGNGYYPYISFVASSSSGNVYTTMVFNVDYRYYEINTSSEDANNIISNSDKNTDVITKNQDENTNKITQKQEETKEAVEDVEDTMKDESPADYGILDDIHPASDSPVSDLLLIPVRLIQKFISFTDLTCSDYNFGKLYNHDLKLNCSDINNTISKLGNTSEYIDNFFVFFMIYNIFMLFVKAWDGFTSLRDEYETLAYAHAPGSSAYSGSEYDPRHGG